MRGHGWGGETREDVASHFDFHHFIFPPPPLLFLSSLIIKHAECWLGVVNFTLHFGNTSTFWFWLWFYWFIGTSLHNFGLPPHSRFNSVIPLELHSTQRMPPHSDFWLCDFIGTYLYILKIPSHSNFDSVILLKHHSTFWECLQTVTWTLWFYWNFTPQFWITSTFSFWLSYFIGTSLHILGIPPHWNSNIDILLKRHFINLD